MAAVEEAAVQCATPCRAPPVCRRLGRRQDSDAQQRREDDGHEPGHDERDADDGKQRERVFARRAGRKADRDEAGDRDQRAGQHGEGIGPEREGRGLHLVVALRQPREHGVGRRHGVVDEQRQRNDERAKRNALHVDVGRAP